VRRAVLADAGPLFAASDDRDQYHDRARRELERLAREQRPIIFPHPLLGECYTLFLRHHPVLLAQTWLAEIQQSVFLAAPEQEDYEDALRRAVRYRDQPISWFDAILAAMSERLRLPVRTFDHHFDVMGVEVWR